MFFLHLRAGGLFFLFIFHTLGGGVSESMEISILFFFFEPFPFLLLKIKENSVLSNYFLYVPSIMLLRSPVWDWALINLDAGTVFVGFIIEPVDSESCSEPLVSNHVWKFIILSVKQLNANEALQ